ncbi:hypothetical protein AK830_g11842 [Neonectria ditissima]|uniref:FMN hydroxy acid dehydrogenase domain-containing protein n=1 Tax=Neonectria ditissima TaxID=78410 RepID=A0A0P7AQJ6_9HYPO|nr:hypothetical protein AK830_g11842 [Neonectria ditissima]
MSDLSAMESETPNIPPPRGPQPIFNNSQPANNPTADVQLPPTVPPLSEILSANDFALAAQKALSPKAWAFYSSAATDQVTLARNRDVVRRVMLRPRILRNVTNVSIERDILGFRSKAPFFMCPAAMATLAHPDGELGWSRAVANEGIFEIVSISIYIYTSIFHSGHVPTLSNTYQISSNASYPLPTIIAAAPPDYPFFLQLYVNSHRAKTVELLQRARSLGIKAVFVTVDAPVPGKREADERTPQAEMTGRESTRDAKGSGLGRLMGQYIDKALEWEDLRWIRDASSVPIVLKGLQTVEDVRLAVEHGADGVVLSNHGGRSLDGSPASILVLLEVRKLFPEAFQHLQIFIDGGFERGSDILKAIALGATAVGIARPFLYSLVYGQKGVEHLSQLLKDELETSMRLAGITSLDQATPALTGPVPSHFQRLSKRPHRLDQLPIRLKSQTIRPAHVEPRRPAPDDPLRRAIDLIPDLRDRLLAANLLHGVQDILHRHRDARQVDDARPAKALLGDVLDAHQVPDHRGRAADPQPNVAAHGEHVGHALQRLAHDARRETRRRGRRRARPHHDRRQPHDAPVHQAPPRVVVDQQLDRQLLGAVRRLRQRHRRRLRDGPGARPVHGARAGEDDARPRRVGPEVVQHRPDRVHVDCEPEVQVRLGPARHEPVEDVHRVEAFSAEELRDGWRRRQVGREGRDASTFLRCRRWHGRLDHIRKCELYRGRRRQKRGDDGLADEASRARDEDVLVTHDDEV